MKLSCIKPTSKVRGLSVEPRVPAQVALINVYSKRLISNKTAYRIAGNFRGVLIFVIFVTIPRVTKFSTHEIFHPRIFSRLLRIGLRESRNLKPRKLILKTRDSFSRKFAPPKITRYTVIIISYTQGRGVTWE